MSKQILGNASNTSEHRDPSRLFGYVSRIHDGAEMLDLFATHEGRIDYDDYGALPPGTHAGHVTYTAYEGGKGMKTHPAILIDPHRAMPEQVTLFLREAHLCWQNMVVQPAHEVDCTLGGQTGRLKLLPALALTRFMNGTAHAFSLKRSFDVQKETGLEIPGAGDAAEKSWPELFHEYQRSAEAAATDKKLLDQFEAATAPATLEALELRCSFRFANFYEKDGAGRLADIAREGVTLAAPTYVDPAATNDQILGMVAQTYLTRETIDRAKALTP